MLDTGSTISSISMDVVKKFNLQIDLNHEEIEQVKGKFESEGTVNIEVRKNSESIKIKTHVAEKLNDDMIIGLNELKKLNLLIILHKLSTNDQIYFEIALSIFCNNKSQSVGKNNILPKDV